MFIVKTLKNSIFLLVCSELKVIYELLTNP